MKPIKNKQILCGAMNWGETKSKPLADWLFLQIALYSPLFWAACNLLSNPYPPDPTPVQLSPAKESQRSLLTTVSSRA